MLPVDLLLYLCKLWHDHFKMPRWGFFYHDGDRSTDVSYFWSGTWLVYVYTQSDFTILCLYLTNKWPINVWIQCRLWLKKFLSSTFPLSNMAILSVELHRVYEYTESKVLVKKNPKKHKAIKRFSRVLTLNQMSYHFLRQMSINLSLIFIRVHRPEIKCKTE